MSTAPTQSADTSDPTPLVSTSQINTADVPEFERDAASGVKLSTGDMAGNISHVDPNNPNPNLVVDTPNRYTASVQAHELAHDIQNAADPKAEGTQAQPAASDYDYGGTDGLAKTMQSGKGISALNSEQQASIPQNYMKEYIKAEKSGDAKAMDKLNAAYEPAIRQLRNMANTSKDSINTTPDAPGAPPSSVTGLAKALPGMYSKSTPSVQLRSSDVHNPPPKTATDQSQTMAVKNPKGMAEAGNLPIWNRPSVKNSDGSHSTEYSTSFNVDGKETLVPTVVNGKFLTPDGKKPAEGSDAEKTMFQAALQHYKDTGQHLGKFDTPANADAYASQLHNRGDAKSQADVAKNKPAAKITAAAYSGAAKAMSGGKKNAKTR
jgi:hypothetical protein